MVSRSYSCLNRRCQYEFTSDGNHPPCPRCRGLRVQWVPKSFGINTTRTASIDKTARELAADFGLTNFRSPEAGRSAVALPATTGQTAGTFEPQPGWKINMPASALSGQGRAVCEPTGVTAKVKVDFGQRAEASKTLGAGSQVQASYRPPGGIPK
jgi:hypothetical protein